MKVMLVIPHVSGGGGEKVLSDLSCHLRAEIVVVVFEEKFSYPIKGRVITLHAPINRASLFRRAFGFVRRILLFRRTLRKEQPDVVLSFMGEANFLNALLSSRPILSVHTHMSSVGTMRSGIEAFVVRVLIRWLYRRAAVVAVSKSVKQDLVEGFGVPEKQIVVIPNAVDVSRVQSLAREKVDCPWNPELPVIVTTGRLSRVKAQWHLIRAFAEVQKTRPCQLAIIGSGELEDYLKTLCRELGIQDNVFFLGWQSNPFKFMARSGVFVLPSLTESFGLVLVEAMACGLPVIATDCPGGSREIISAGTAGPCGVLVPVPDGAMYTGSDPSTREERYLAEQLVRMLDDRPTRESYIRAGRVRASDFDIEAFTEKYQQLLAASISSDVSVVPE
jgi:glycosyltransferase involved in cell wall biosynthesis